MCFAGCHGCAHTNSPDSNIHTFIHLKNECFLPGPVLGKGGSWWEVVCLADEDLAVLELTFHWRR